MSQRWFIKRVPFEFDWPIGQVWHGYINPWPGPIPCPLCRGTGLNEECTNLYLTFRKWAGRLTKLELASAKQSGMDFCEVMKLQSRNWSADSPLIRSYLIQIRARRRGVWGLCELCAGTQTVPNQNPAVQRLYIGVNLYEEWQPIEPPLGEAWQLWEFEPPDGRPVSTTFGSAELLAKWCASSFKSDEAKWLRWILHEGLKKELPKPVFQLHREKLFSVIEPKRGEA